MVDEPEIGDVDEGVVEGGEDTGNAENEFTCQDGGVPLATIFSCFNVPERQRVLSSAYPHGPEGRGRCSPEQGGRSSWGGPF